jgi:hypothetical protein
MQAYKSKGRRLRTDSSQRQVTPSRWSGADGSANPHEIPRFVEALLATPIREGGEQPKMFGMVFTCCAPPSQGRSAQCQTTTGFSAPHVGGMVMHESRAPRRRQPSRSSERREPRWKSGS